MKLLIALTFFVSVCVSQSVEENDFNTLSVDGIIKHIPLLKTIRGVLFSFEPKKELVNLTANVNQKKYDKKEVSLYSYKIRKWYSERKKECKIFIDLVKKGFGPEAKHTLILSSITTMFTSISRFLKDYYNKLIQNNNVNAPVKNIVKPKIGFIISNGSHIRKKHSAELSESSSTEFSDNRIWAKPKFMISTELQSRKKRVAPLIIAGAIYSGKVIIWSISMGVAGVATGVALAYYHEHAERKNMKERMATACEIYNSGCLLGFCWSNCGPRFVVCRIISKNFKFFLNKNSQIFGRDFFYNLYFFINFYLFLIITASRLVFYG